MTTQAELTALVVADSRDRERWLAVRSRGIGGSDVAGFAKLASVGLYVAARFRRPFSGNANTQAGNRWESSILAAYGWQQNTLMFRHPDNDRFLATPDAYRITESGTVKLAQAKTKHHEPFDDDGKPRPFTMTNAKGEIHVTPAHRRQIAWEQVVLGATTTDYLVMPIHPRTLMPVADVPTCVTIARDDEVIAGLLAIAHPYVAALVAATEFERNIFA